MDCEDVIILVKNLGWDQPQEKQDEAIQFLSEIDEKYYYLIFDKTSKATWENAVEVIRRIDKEKARFFIPILLWLLQDINWPGALQATEILSEFDKEIIMPLLERTIREAYRQGDYMWLGGLKLLVEKTKVEALDFYENDTYSLLEFSDF